MGASASLSPSESPSVSPSKSPSVSPSGSPSKSPSVSPSASPSPMPAGHVTYTIRDRVRIGKKYMIHALIEFGASTNDLYPAGGVALTNSSMGLRNTPNSVTILESNGATAIYEWDRSANTIRIFSAIATEYDSNVTTMSNTALEVMIIGW